MIDEIKTRGDKDKVLGDFVTWGRSVATQFKELRRLIDKFNEQQAGQGKPAGETRASEPLP